MASHDLEDVLLIVEGRPQFVDEILAADPEVRTFVAEEVARLLTNPEFEYFIAGNIKGPGGRVEIVYKRLETLAGVGKV
ncbi:hypothetical protein [Asticcacaulis sp. AC402]|uniref:hypothetical protein n=1 Tax=Asticcacaulis sp. AC402 TaxID=1282361 RepID=UPI0003C409D5|nr:hypothetical protein [Asticcacaulis sp. AC402]ESQ75184.1 hypothetical protein ABAC402_10975 [Asticcacaulis sp. AC402]